MYGSVLSSALPPVSLFPYLSPTSRELFPPFWRVFFTPTIDTIFQSVPFRAVCLDLKVPTPLDVLQPYQMIVNSMGIRVCGLLAHE